MGGDEHIMLLNFQLFFLAILFSSSSSALLLTKFIGNGLCSMVYFCQIEPMTCSTWIRAFAIVLVSSISNAVSCCLPLVNAGIWSLVFIIPTDSAISKPLSAKVTLLGSNFCNDQSSTCHLRDHPNIPIQTHLVV